MSDPYLVARFWAKVDVRRVGECWPWRAARNEHSYGVFRVAGRNVKAHRQAMEISADITLTPDQVVLHSCDNPSCCNPAHLVLGSQEDNIADMVAKGRQRGSRHSRLTPDQITTIRTELTAGATQHELAERFGVSPSYLSMLAAGKRWRREEVA
jgi:hypothetical protein